MFRPRADGGMLQEFVASGGTVALDPAYAGIEHGSILPSVSTWHCCIEPHHPAQGIR